MLNDATIQQHLGLMRRTESASRAGIGHDLVEVSVGYEYATALFNIQFVFNLL